ncbi:hypothetical protein [Yoonia sp. R2-816]|uniref:hypothetical protein n=1 Tax=Yoonia sp. R2-816 TaxID=3342638 RepID=UPI003727C5E4
MDDGQLAKRTAEMADRSTQRINHQTFLGQDSMVLPYDEALLMAEDLLKMSQRFAELQEEANKYGRGTVGIRCRGDGITGRE